MPRLVAFLPCEKVVLEQGSNNASIIAVLDSLTLTVPKDTPAPQPQTALAMPWAIFTLFQKEDNDTGEFECKSVLMSDSGEVLMDGPVSKFSFNVPRMRIVMQVNGFPIWVPGQLWLALMLKAPGQSDFGEVARTSITLAFAEAPSP